MMNNNKRRWGYWYIFNKSIYVYICKSIYMYIYVYVYIMSEFIMKRYFYEVYIYRIVL